MQIVTDIRSVILTGPTVLTIGNFDGLHLGHQALLDTQSAIAQSHVPPARSAIMTFTPHPLAVLRPGFSPSILTKPRYRVELAEAHGIDLGIIQPFTRELAALSASDFLTLLVENLGLVCLVVGPDFALGRDRDGNLDALRELGRAMGFEISVITPQAKDGEPVRSSVIRQQVRQGNVFDAARLLGRPHKVTGMVKSGDKRGRQIGVPTANVHTPPEILLPADGVYATRTISGAGVDAAIYDSVTNLGVRPTVDGMNHRLETHLFDFPRAGETGNLYETEISVDFYQRLRGEKRFDGLEQLVAQIHEDMAQTKRFFANLESAAKSKATLSDPDV